ncbi:phage tail protein [Orbaceae bacterium ESL0721]|nr:phage tail protein [Orbaceae bacterium ESL0721]
MGGKSSKKKVTVGYRYYWDLFAGLGRGPINSIVAILADKKIVYIGKKDELSTNTSFYINKPNLFGGEDTGGEGGIQGTLDIFMGEKNQVPSDKLKNLLKGLVPGFRGIVTTLFSGLVSCYSASPKPWVYRVRRTNKGWDNNKVWYPEKCLILLHDDTAEVTGINEEINARLPKKASEAEKNALYREIESNIREIHAMNPAHILIECATNRDWGRGLSFDDIDLESFKQSADKLYDEKFGLCFRYNRQDKLDTFVQQILDHIGAAQYADLSTGKLKLKLIRDDYDVDKLPLFTYDNGILSVQDDDSASIDAAPNEVAVTYHNPVTNEDAEVRAQNLASIQAVGLISSSTDYKALPTHDLAARVAQRDLETSVAGITRLVIKFDRRGGVLEPASCFRVSLPDRDIDNMILRVGKIEEQDDGAFLITGVQDVFGFSSTSYSSNQQGSEWIAPDQSVNIVTDVKLIELPYAVLVNTLSTADLAYVHETAGYIGVMATAPSALSINYLLQSRAQGADFTTKNQGDWIPSGQLITTIDRLTTTFEIDSDYLPKVGDGIMIDDEIMRIDTIDVENRIITAGRGCLDTLPSCHYAGSTIRLYDNLDTDNIEYMSGEKVDVKLLTQTSVDTLDENIAPIESIIMSHRQIRPYLPGKIAINTVLYPEEITKSDKYVLTFVHRDRVMQADRLIDCMADNIGPEQGTTYHIEITDTSNNVIWQINTANISIELPYLSNADTDDIHLLTLYSVRNGYESLNRFTVKLPEGHING